MSNPLGEMLNPLGEMLNPLGEMMNPLGEMTNLQGAMLENGDSCYAQVCKINFEQIYSIALFCLS